MVDRHGTNPFIGYEGESGEVVREFRSLVRRDDLTAQRPIADAGLVGSAQSGAGPLTADFGDSEAGEQHPDAGAEQADSEGE